MAQRFMTDTDLYKFTMMQVVLHRYAGTMVRYAFKWRNWDKIKHLVTAEDVVAKAKFKIDQLCKLRFIQKELNFMGKIPFLKRDFIEYLRLFQFNRDHIDVFVRNGEPHIEIAGPWLSTILFEVPVLTIMSETYTELQPTYGASWQKEAMDRLVEKTAYVEKHLNGNFFISDFGTRRRASFETQEMVIRHSMERLGRNFAGTSNVYFAMKFGIKAMGTMAHEWLQAHQQLGSRLVDSQAAAFQAWADEYRGELGIALSDVVGHDAFLVDFDRYFALLFDGTRHDSGCPFNWGQNTIKMYEGHRIAPRTKSAVWSDGLDYHKCVELNTEFGNHIGNGFGVGTYLTNDCGFIPPSIVLKLVEVNGLPVAKISDSPGKGMCEDPEFLSYLTKVMKEKVRRGKR